MFPCARFLFFIGCVGYSGLLHFNGLVQGQLEDRFLHLTWSRREGVEENPKTILKKLSDDSSTLSSFSCHQTSIFSHFWVPLHIIFHHFNPRLRDHFDFVWFVFQIVQIFGLPVRTEPGCDTEGGHSSGFSAHCVRLCSNSPVGSMGWNQIRSLRQPCGCVCRQPRAEFRAIS